MVLRARTPEAPEVIALSTHRLLTERLLTLLTLLTERLTTRKTVTQ